MGELLILPRARDLVTSLEPVQMDTHGRVELVDDLVAGLPGQAATTEVDLSLLTVDRHGCYRRTASALEELVDHVGVELRLDGRELVPGRSNEADLLEVLVLLHSALPSFFIGGWTNPILLLKAIEIKTKMLYHSVAIRYLEKLTKDE